MHARPPLRRSPCDPGAAAPPPRPPAMAEHHAKAGDRPAAAQAPGVQPVEDAPVVAGHDAQPPRTAPTRKPTWAAGCRTVGESNFFLETFDIKLNILVGAQRIPRPAVCRAAKCPVRQGRRPGIPGPCITGCTGRPCTGPGCRAGTRWWRPGPAQRCTAAPSRSSSRSLVESPSRRPTSLFSGRRRSASQTILAFGLIWADQLVGQIADGMLNAGGNVQLLADGGVAVGNGHKAVGRVLDIVEVAGRGQAAEFDLGLARQQLGDDGRR